MSSTSSIAWTEATWNPILGCTKISDGCKNCYAIYDCHRMAGNPNEVVRKANADLTQIQAGRPNWTGTVRLIPERLTIPKQWKTPRRIFVNSLSDLFHESLALADIRQVIDAAAACPLHTFQALTKRGENLRRLAPQILWPKNFWMGVTVENTTTLRRIDDLRDTKASVKYISFEPLIGPISESTDLRGIDWIIIAGETGRRNGDARSCEIEWIRALIRAGRRDGCAVFVKQLGQRPTLHNQPYAITGKKGKLIDEWPSDIRVQEYPMISTVEVAA